MLVKNVNQRWSSREICNELVSNLRTLLVPVYASNNPIYVPNLSTNLTRQDNVTKKSSKKSSSSSAASSIKSKVVNLPSPSRKENNLSQYQSGFEHVGELSSGDELSEFTLNVNENVKNIFKEIFSFFYIPLFLYAFLGLIVFFVRIFFNEQ